MDDGRLRNTVHSALLIGAMVGLLCLLGWMFWGTAGLVFLGIVGGVGLLTAGRMSSTMILRMYGARPVGPAAAPRLVETVDTLARRARVEAPGVYYVPSQVVTAFTLGSRGNAAIAVTDGILRTLSFRELTAVLAHEMSHVRSNDVRVMGLADLVSRATSILSFLGQFLLLINLPLLLMGQVTIPWLGILLLIFAPTLTALLQLALSRRREYDADRGAVELSGDPRGLASALAKLERLNAGVFERVLLPGRRVPEPSLLRTHPQTEDRIARLLEMERQMEERRVQQDEWDTQVTGEIPGVSLGVVPVPRWHGSWLWF